ncbi:MAG: hypothetical protein J7502_01280 [Flavisolibacter sp.]|nr:hypothetical protein [Flavisolibacter sp.]
MASITSVKGKGRREGFPDFRDHTPSPCKLSPKQKAGAAKKPVSKLLKNLIEKNSSGQKKDSLMQKNICVNGVHPSKTRNLNPCITHVGTDFFKLNLVL